SMMLSAFTAPVVPERFQGSVKTVYDKQGKFVLIKYSFACPEQPLTTDDELLLQWGQMGVSLTAQWADGQLQQSLFLRRLDGIPVPIRLLRQVDVPYGEVLKAHLYQGFRSGLTCLQSWLFALCLACLLVDRERRKTLLAVCLGLLLTLILRDVNVPLPPPFLYASLFAVGCVLLARTVLRGGPSFLLLFVLVCLGGLLAPIDVSLTTQQQLAASFMSQTGWITIVVGMAVILSCAARLTVLRQTSLYIVGILAVALACSSFVEGLSPILESSHRMLERVTAAQVALPDASNNNLTGGGAPRPKPQTQLDDPLAAFLTIEPYETRLEILVKVADTQTWPGVSFAT
ncbi:MAG: hypothetical protein MI922_30410, partial [Bacteroidales bacterium]|nr:hypothetical protein [Bacteroidales bacterium]